MMRASTSLIYRDRLGKVLVSVVGSTLTGSEVRIFLAQGSTVTVLPVSITESTRDLDLPGGDIMLYLLLRGTSRQRLLHRAGWLPLQLDASLAHYTHEIRIDLEASSSQLDIGGKEVSLGDIVAVGEKVCSSFFRPASTELQLEILGRPEVLLTLIEGWVDHIMNRAISSWVTNSMQLDEVVRRRRASVRPTREVFQGLPGLELCPCLVHDAESLWAAMGHRHRAAGRDGV